jgi:hypothetical protein
MLVAGADESGSVETIASSAVAGKGSKESLIDAEPLLAVVLAAGKNVFMSASSYYCNLKGHMMVKSSRGLFIRKFN